MSIVLRRMNSNHVAKSAPLKPVQAKLLQRKCACGGALGVSGECEECRKKRLRLQRRVANQKEATSVPSIVHEVLRSPGQPLDTNTRNLMESRFGHNFSKVRVHSDTKAAESAQVVNALAYTVGRDIVFGTGLYAPGSLEGRRLLAHELTHTIQQSQTPRLSMAKVEIERPDDPSEIEAERTASTVVQSLHHHDIPPGRHSFIDLRHDSRPLEEEEEPAEETSPVVQVSRRITNSPRINRRARALWPIDRWENPAVRIALGEVPGQTELEMNGNLIESGADLDAAIPNPPIVGRPTADGNFECKIERPIDLTCRNRRIMPWADESGAWWSRIDVAVLRDLGFDQCTGAHVPDRVRFKLTAKPSAKALTRRIIRSEYEHVKDTFETFRTHLVPLHDRYAHHAASFTTGPDAQSCAETILNDIDREQRMLDFLQDYIARQQAHDGPGGNHNTEAPITVNRRCTFAHAEAQV